MGKKELFTPCSIGQHAAACEERQGRHRGLVTVTRYSCLLAANKRESRLLSAAAPATWGWGERRRREELATVAAHARWCRSRSSSGLGSAAAAAAAPHPRAAPSRQVNGLTLACLLRTRRLCSCALLLVDEVYPVVPMSRVPNY